LSKDEEKMKLNFEQIKEIVHGAARIEEVDGRVDLYRFTREQQDMYENVSEDFYIRSFTTANISLEFDTDSDFLGLEVSVKGGGSNCYFVHGIFVDGERIGELAGTVDSVVERTFFAKEFLLKSGIKRVKIVFPWEAASSIVGLKLEDGAKIVPVTKDCKLLIYGDSITQGYSSAQPERTYAVQLATLMNAEVRNKAIGGEHFYPPLALLKDDFEPDVIVVAYGTNDWSHHLKEEFEETCVGFYKNLRNTYPNVKIIALTPLWRANLHEKKPIGVPLSYIAEYIKGVAEHVSDMKVIDCFDFIPHELQYYQADGLHPVDAGFDHYAKNLWNVLQ